MRRTRGKTGGIQPRTAEDLFLGEPHRQTAVPIVKLADGEVTAEVLGLSERSSGVMVSLQHAYGGVYFQRDEAILWAGGVR
ncbi:MAG: hypothetical protein AAGF12_42380 [Myxococcota bacterium]